MKRHKYQKHIQEVVSTEFQIVIWKSSLVSVHIGGIEYFIAI